MPKGKDKDGKDVLTEKEKQFCREYIIDWNATRSYLKAYPHTHSYGAAGVQANKTLKKPKIAAFIAKIQQNLEKEAGVSRLRVMNEYMKIAFCSHADIHNTWIERREFDELPRDVKDCIQEISTKVSTVMIGDIPKEIEFVKIKLYDKQEALKSIRTMLGYDDPQKIDLTTQGKPIYTDLTDEQLVDRARKLLSLINHEKG